MAADDGQRNPLTSEHNFERIRITYILEHKGAILL